MKTYLILLRGVNVGVKNKISMKVLNESLEALGFRNVRTYIASGNVILQSDQSADQIQGQIETLLPNVFELEELVKVLVLTHDELRAIVKNRPAGFGDQPDMYHSDALFLMGITAADTMSIFNPREGVDRVWPGDGVIYSQRLSALRSKSRLNRAMSTPAYKSMTIRSWSTTMRLLDILDEVNVKDGDLSHEGSSH